MREEHAAARADRLDVDVRNPLTADCPVLLLETKACIKDRLQTGTVAVGNPERSALDLLCLSETLDRVCEMDLDVR